VFVIEPSIYLRLIGSKDFFTLIAHAHIATSERIESICCPKPLNIRIEIEQKFAMRVTGRNTMNEVMGDSNAVLSKYDDQALHLLKEFSTFFSIRGTSWTYKMEPWRSKQYYL